MPKPPTQEELRQRVIAARILRGVSQEQLTNAGHELGLFRQELMRAERGDLPLTQARLNAITGVLDLPDYWFTATTVDDLLAAGGTDKTLERMDKVLEVLWEQRAELVAQGARIAEMDRKIVKQLAASARERANGMPAKTQGPSAGRGRRRATD